PAGMPLKGGDLLTRGDVPHFHCRVSAAADQEPAVRRESDKPDLTLVQRQSREFLLRGDIPQLHDSSPTARSQKAPGGGECQGVEGRLLLQVAQYLSPRGNVP